MKYVGSQSVNEECSFNFLGLVGQWFWKVIFHQKFFIYIHILLYYINVTFNIIMLYCIIT